MKKKLWIIILCVLLVLLTPIPSGTYKDGGTREYTALTYKIVNWQHLTANGGMYKKLKIYPFPLNFFSIDSLLAREEKNFPKETASQETSSEEYNHLLEYEQQYIRTDGYHEDIKYPKIVLIDSLSELNEYYENNKELYDFNSSSDERMSFTEAIKVYNQSFFKNHKLILVLLQEGSGSTRHKITGVGKNSDNKLEIKIETMSPEVGTCDMALWHILIDVDREIDDEKNIIVNLNGKKYTNIEESEEEYVYCGNTQTTVKFSDNKTGKEKSYTFMGSESVKLTDTLRKIKYNKGLCRCTADYTVVTEFGTYGVKLEGEQYARSNGKQADLNAEQIDIISRIIDWAKNKAE